MKSSQQKRYNSRMVTIAVDLCVENFAHELVDGEDATELFLLAPRLGVTPDKLIVVKAHRQTGGNQFTMPTANCHASFNDEAMAREWFAWAANDANFDENVVT